MDRILLFFLLPFFYALQTTYLSFASRMRIIPRHQNQSKRNRIVTGAGIIFPFAWLLFFLLNDFVFPIYTIAIVSISLVCFLADIVELDYKIQLVLHLLALTGIFAQFHYFTTLSLPLIVLAYLLSMLLIVGFELMDGINGMLGLVAYVFFICIAFTDNVFLSLEYSNPLIFIFSSIFVFGFVNFRKKAIAFAGTVGSASMAYLALFFLLQLIFGGKIMLKEIPLSDTSLMTFQPQYLLVFTILAAELMYVVFKRISKGENPLIPQKDHVYHLLTIDKQLPHVLVASFYAVAHLAIGMVLLLM